MAVFAGPRERAAAGRPQERRVAQLAFIEPPIGANIQAVQDIYGRPGAPAANMRHSAVWACQDLIASMMSMLQPWAFKTPPAGVATPNPGQGGTGQPTVPGVKVAVQPQILNEPAAGMDIGDWLYAGTLSLLRGNVYGSVVGQTPLGFPSQIELKDPGKCSVRQLADGTVQYKFSGKVQDSTQPPVWHRSIFRGPGELTGASIMEFARRAIQLGLNAEQFANGFFEEGAHPSSILTNESTAQMSQKEAATIKQKFMAAVHGSREPALLTGGWKYQQIQVNPTDSQFLGTLSASDLMVCRFHRVPPEIVACAITGSAITYANVEQRGLDFLTYCMQRWITWWERKLGALQPSGQYVKFDLSPLLRTDILTRWVVNYAQLTSRAMTQTEVRAGEDMAPLTPEQLAEVNAVPQMDLLQPLKPPKLSL
jgi:HK97 family phage portal protein